MDKKFKIPLAKKRTDFAFHGISSPEGFKEMRKAYIERFATDPLAKPDLKPLIACTASKDCKNVYDPNTGKWSGGCAGFCSYC